MPKKILSVLSHTEYGNLEDSDIGLFASAFAPVAGSQVTILLTEDAVNYGVRGQEGNIPVYAFTEDLDERGIGGTELIDGIKTISRKEYARFIDQFDTVWNW